MDKEVKANASKEAAEMRKRAGVPEIDPDAKPSSSAPKIVSCATKHVKKLADLIEIFKGIDKPTAIQTRSPSCTIPSYHKSHGVHAFMTCSCSRLAIGQDVGQAEQGS